MEFDFIKYKESENIIPLEIKNKECYYQDLHNIEQSWTSRVDAQIANTFFMESVQLVINAIVLFEKGYFDCAFYSLRQSLEVSTTIVYLIDTDDSKRDKELFKWKSQSKFPMYSQMLRLLEENGRIFFDIKEKMSSYFNDIDNVKNRLNKYVHKQGFNRFYISRNYSVNLKKNHNPLLSEFESFLIKCIGAIAVFRLVIDPLPILLGDEEIYKRTEDFLTNAYTQEFIEKYIGLEHIEAYKKTELYTNHYNTFIKEEPKLPSVVDIVKYQYIDKNKIDEILSQKHLLGRYDYTAVVLSIFSEKIAKIYCLGGLLWYFTNVKTVRNNTTLDTREFENIKNSEKKFNNPYDEAYISTIEIDNESYFIEHNEEFTFEQIIKLGKMIIQQF